jgi:hypothetical protein
LRFNILLISLTFNSNLCLLRTRYVITYSFRRNAEPQMTTLLPGPICGSFSAACLSQEVTRNLTCSPVSHFWSKRCKTLFCCSRTKVHNNTERDFIVKYIVFVLQYSVYYNEDFFYCEKRCKNDFLQNVSRKNRIKFLFISFFKVTVGRLFKIFRTFS